MLKLLKSLLELYLGYGLGIEAFTTLGSSNGHPDKIIK